MIGTIHSPPADMPIVDSPREIMNTSFARNNIGVACALALGFASSAVQAQSAFNDPSQRALIYNQQDPQVIKSGFGLCWHSGFGPPPAPTAECDPNYRAATPAVAPLVASAPVQVAPPVAIAKPRPPVPVAQKITIDADALFDFDKSTLRPEGRSALDAFVAKLKDVEPETIIAIGHTDRFGSDQYNQALSERRVGTVRTYLMDKGVGSAKMHTEGKGEKQPVTRAGDCQGGKSAKVIACLQPDRRVEVEVIGTRIVR